MIQWEAWCYRCRGRDTGVEDTEHRCREMVAAFRHDHQGSCGAATSIGSLIEQVPPSGTTVSMTGDGFTRQEAS